GLLVAAPGAEAELPEDAQARPRLRRQDRLPDAETVHEAHLPEALQRRAPRIRYLPFVGRARHVAEGEPRVVVGRPGEAIEVVLAHAPTPPGLRQGRSMSRVCACASSMRRAPSMRRAVVEVFTSSSMSTSRAVNSNVPCDQVSM